MYISDSYTRRPVAFLARLEDNHLTVKRSPIVFGIAELNTGDAYDAGTGKFTAPISGLYLFSVQICIDQNESLEYQIMSRNRILSGTRHGEDHYKGLCSSVTTVASLSFGEKVWVSTSDRNTLLLSDNSPSQPLWTMFTGVLIQSGV